MGNGNLKAAVHIKLNKSEYSPEEEVKGKVYFQLSELSSSGVLVLKFQGREQTFLDDSEFYGQPRIRVAETKLVDVRVPIYNFDCSLEEGLRVFYFSFILPGNLPGTFRFGNEDSFAEIKYTLTVEFTNQNNQKFSNSRQLLIVEKPQLAQTLCIEKRVSQGRSFLRKKGFTIVKFELSKDIYTPEDNLCIKANLDNSNSMRNISQMTIDFFRTVKVCSKNKSFKLYKQKLLSKTLSGVGAGETMLTQDFKEIEFDLKQGRLDFVYTTQSKLVQCLYSLELELETEETSGCCQSPYKSCLMFCPRVLPKLFN